jgi:nitroreductase
MDLIEAMRTTHACRAYKTDPVPDDLLVKVLDGARWAPSGSNKQPVTFLVVKDAAKRRALHDLYQPLWDDILQKYEAGDIRAGFRPGFMQRVDHFAKHLKDVPVMIVVCAAVDELTPMDANLGRLTVAGGSSIYPAVQNLMLAARNEGLGTTLTTILCIAEADVRALLGIPDDIATTAMITLGWPAKPFPKKLHRKPLADIAFLDVYGTVLPGADAL